MIHPLEISGLLESITYQPDYLRECRNWRFFTPYVCKYHHMILRHDYLPKLAKLFSAIAPKNYLVIGGLLGTTEAYALRFTDFRPEAIVVCDLDIPNYSPERENLAYVYKNITNKLCGGYDGLLVIIRGDSKKPVTQSAIAHHGKYDLIYIDGEHTYEAVMADLGTAFCCLSRTA